MRLLFAVTAFPCSTEVLAFVSVNLGQSLFLATMEHLIGYVFLYLIPTYRLLSLPPCPLLFKVHLHPPTLSRTWLPPTLPDPTHNVSCETHAKRWTASKPAHTSRWINAQENRISSDFRAWARIDYCLTCQTKVVVYGVLYGQSADALVPQLRLSRPEAFKIRQTVLKTYPKVCDAVKKLRVHEGTAPRNQRRDPQPQPRNIASSVC